MDLDDWGKPGFFPDLEGAALQEVLDELCERRQGLFLATPYLTFASRFLGRAGRTLDLRATMNRQVAQHTLGGRALELRFPWGLTLLGGATRLLDYLEEEGGRILRVAVPTRLSRREQRLAYRTDRIGRTTGTLGVAETEALAGMSFVRFNLEDISTLGVRVFCADPLPGALQVPGRRATLEFTLDQGPDIQATVQVCHVSGQSVGLSFVPPLEGLLLAELRAWIQPRFEEALRRWESRAALRAQAERAAAPRPEPSGILLVTGDAHLAAGVTEALAGAMDVRTTPPVLAPFREALESAPPYALLLPTFGNLDDYHRLKGLVEKCPPPCPVVVMNLGGTPEGMRTFAREIRASLATDLTHRKPLFFRRLLVGLIRKHWRISI
jgi:hypothetical protein